MQTRRWITLLVCVVLAIAGLSLWKQVRPSDSPVANKGVFTLSMDDLSDGNIPLNGEWEFYPGQLLEPIDFQSNMVDKPPTNYIQVPRQWNKSLEDESWNYGTYRLLITNDQASHQNIQYGMSTTTIFMSYKLYINGQLRVKSGEPATTIERYRPEIIPQITLFDSQSETIEIVLQVANFDHYTGGITSPIYFGYGQEILHSKYINVGIQMGTSIVLFVFFVVFSLLFFFYNRQLNLIIVSVFFLFFALNIAMNKERFFIQYFPFLPMELMWSMKHFSIYISAPLLSYLTTRFFGHAKINILHVLPAIILGLYCIVIVILPYKWFILFEQIALIVFICFYVLLFISLYIRCTREDMSHSNRGEMRYFLFAMLILLIFRVNNIFSARYYFPENHISTLAIMAFIILITFMLVQQYWTTYKIKVKMAQQLRKTDARKDEFLLRTSVELKTPISGLINLSQSMLATQSELNKGNLGLIRDTAFRMSNIVDGISDWVKMKDGRLSVQMKRVDIATMISVIIEQVQFISTNKHVRFQVNMQNNARYINADEQRILQVLYHLIDSGLRLIDHGLINIASYLRNDQVRLRICIQNEGVDLIPSDVVIQAFHQRSLNEEKDIRGLDWSFTIVQHLVDLMGGRLEMNQLKDANYEINLAFPAALPITESPFLWEERLHQEVKLSHASIPKNGSCTVLVVDSDPVSLEIIVHLLAVEGIKVIVARSEAEAMDNLQTPEKPDIVLLNMLMNDYGGYHLCRKIRNNYTDMEMPILFVAARNTPIDIESGLKAGGNDYITKPFDASEVRARIHTLQLMKRLSQEAAMNEMAFLRSQINPHFLYNTLGSIMSLCYTDGRSAGKLISTLSKYLRILFQVAPGEQVVKLRKELEFIRAYIDIEKARFGNKLSFDLNVDATLLDYKIASMFIQPLVENAIQHGIAKRVEGGKVQLHVSKVDNMLKIIVEDDGVGISKQKQDEIMDLTKKNQGIGLSNIMKRIAGMTAKPVELWSKEGEGTRITLWLPIHEIQRR